MKSRVSPLVQDPASVLPCSYLAFCSALSLVYVLITLVGVAVGGGGGGGDGGVVGVDPDSTARIWGFHPSLCPIRRDTGSVILSGFHPRFALSNDSSAKRCASSKASDAFFLEGNSCSASHSSVVRSSRFLPKFSRAIAESTL